MDVQKLIGDKLAALPEELAPVIAHIIAGEIKSLAVIVELQDGTIGDLFYTDMNDGRSNLFAVLGAMEALKRDFMRSHIESRVSYEEIERQDDE